MQVLQFGAEHGLGVAPDLHFAHAGLQAVGGRHRPGLADHMAVLAQAVLAQGLHDGIALGRAHLQHHAQLFVEQGFEREFFAPRADLPGPVFAVAMLGSTVGYAVALRHEHVHVERHADLTGKGHLGHCGQQATVTAVVVGQNLTLCAQGVDGFDQVHQVLRLVQVRHHITGLVERLRQDAAAHAVFSPAQVNQDQRAVGLGGVELGGQRAAHVRQCGEGGDDQAHGGRDLLFIVMGIRPLRAHRQTVFAHGDGDAQCRAQLHAHGVHRGVERGVFTGLATGGHPVGG